MGSYRPGHCRIDSNEEVDKLARNGFDITHQREVFVYDMPLRGRSSEFAKKLMIGIEREPIFKPI